MKKWNKKDKSNFMAAHARSPMFIVEIFLILRIQKESGCKNATKKMSINVAREIFVA